jgi:hypothetical protein
VGDIGNTGVKGAESGGDGVGNKNDEAETEEGDDYRSMNIDSLAEAECVK